MAREPSSSTRQASEDTYRWNQERRITLPMSWILAQRKPGRRGKLAHLRVDLVIAAEWNEGWHVIPWARTYVIHVRPGHVLVSINQWAQARNAPWDTIRRRIRTIATREGWGFDRLTPSHPRVKPRRRVPDEEIWEFDQGDPGRKTRESCQPVEKQLGYLVSINNYGNITSIDPAVDWLASRNRNRESLPSKPERPTRAPPTPPRSPTHQGYLHKPPGPLEHGAVQPRRLEQQLVRTLARGVGRRPPPGKACEEDGPAQSSPNKAGVTDRTRAPGETDEQWEVHHRALDAMQRKDFAEGERLMEKWAAMRSSTESTDDASDSISTHPRLAEGD